MATAAKMLDPWKTPDVVILIAWLILAKALWP